MGRRLVRWVAAVVVVVAAVGLGWWAGRVTLSDPVAGAPVGPVVVTSRVVEASVGQALGYNVTVRQPVEVLGTNLLSGVVTSVSPGVLGQGGVAYTVAGVPVRVVAGSVPFYRDLGPGARGEDVRQVQQVVADGGYGVAVDGVWGARTTAAVRAWQQDTGVEVTGMVRLGTLVAVPRVPLTVAVGEQVRPGALLAGGEAGVVAHVGEPEFVIAVTEEQAARVPVDASVTATFGEYVWDAVITGSQVRENGVVDLVLAAPGGGVVCGAQCGVLPAAESTTLTGRVQVVPDVTGPAVPVAAVRTDDGGAAYVALPDGGRAPVRVLASGDGLAVVEGLAVGDEFVVLRPAGEG